MLELRRVGSGYGALQVLWDIDLRVERGEWVALVGAAGAGKTTLLRTIAGSLAPVSGEIRFEDVELAEVPAHERVKRGMSLVPEGRRLFRGMTVAENLTAGAFVVRGRARVAERLERVHELFPVLAERAHQQVGTLSGGEQQMCAIGRALMSRPKMILLDEPSLGVAPQVVEEIFEIVKDLNGKEGVSFLLAEQNTNMALKYATYGYILENGRVVMDGDARMLAENADVKEFYLGIAEGRRRSFRDSKHYRRRKRWLA
jgi:branched-chain amino acid transport system ATP-binding protein